MQFSDRGSTQKVQIGVLELRTGRSVERRMHYLIEVGFVGCRDMVDPPTERHLEVDNDYKQSWQYRNYQSSWDD
jgi:hypothetical protein